MWQKCPICNGVGIDPSLHSSSICPTCQGMRIISEISGLPPTSIPPSYDTNYPIGVPNDSVVANEKKESNNYQEDWIPMDEVQSFLNYKATQMSAFIKNPLLKVAKVGKRKFINRESLNDFMMQQTLKSKTK